MSREYQEKDLNPSSEYDKSQAFADPRGSGVDVVPAAEHHYDPERQQPQIIVNGPTANGELVVHRQLKQRHMAMIALGGAIGTGLFIGSGGALESAGPVGVWLGYIFMSSMVYAMMVALGEMAALYPLSGGFTHYAARFVDPALGFALGINYWYSWAVTMPTEVVAAQIVISYWDTKTPAAAYITVMMVAIWAINLWGARAYGEAEFWFSSIKIVTIVGLLILSLILMCGGGPTHDPIGFRYWRNPGPFNNIAIHTQTGEPSVVPGNWGKFLAFWYVFVQAAYSFIGTEIIATTLGEAENPRKTVPRAIRRVFWRLFIFYVLGIFFVSVLVPYNSEQLLNAKSGTAGASPFVIAIQNAKIKALPSIINAVLLVSAWSAGNSDVYAGSRTMYALAIQGQLPKIFRKCTKRGLPVYCVIVTCAFGPLAYLATGVGGAVVAFNWLYNIASITGILSWWTILLSYIRFYHGLKKQGLSRKEFPFIAPLQPWLSYYGFIFFTLILLFAGFQVFLAGNWNVSNFLAAYITIPIFAAAYLFWKIFRRPSVVKLAEIDFMTGRRELDEMEELDAERFKPRTWWEKVLSILF